MSPEKQKQLAEDLGITQSDILKVIPERGDGWSVLTPTSFYLVEWGASQGKWAIVSQTDNICDFWAEFSK